MTAAQKLALVTDENENLGDESPALDQFQPIDVDPNAISDLEFRLKISNELLSLARKLEETRRIVNRITTRFAIEGRPLPEDSNAA